MHSKSMTVLLGPEFAVDMNVNCTMRNHMNEVNRMFMFDVNDGCQDHDMLFRTYDSAPPSDDGNEIRWMEEMGVRCCC
jgi:hypothetical protein